MIKIKPMIFRGRLTGDFPEFSEWRLVTLRNLFDIWKA